MGLSYLISTVQVSGGMFSSHIVVFSHTVIRSSSELKYLLFEDSPRTVHFKFRARLIFLSRKLPHGPLNTKSLIAPFWLCVLCLPSLITCHVTISTLSILQNFRLALSGHLWHQNRHLFISLQLLIYLTRGHWRKKKEKKKKHTQTIEQY